MSNPVGGSGNPNQPPPNDNRGSSGIFDRIRSFLRGIFNQRASSLADRLFGRVSAGEVKLSKEDILKHWLESQPENAKAEAEQIVSMLLQKNLENLFELNIQNYHNITSLPNVLQNCTGLDCSGCTSLQAVPELPACTALWCLGCTSLRALPELLNCFMLDCEGCTNLQALPELLNCYVLRCGGCTSLQALLGLRNCSKLDCSDCTSLQTLPFALPACTELDCSGCTSLNQLPAFPVCTALDCRGCTSLQALPELLDCEWLDCSDCTCLQALPEFPVCKWLDCSGCESLQTLPFALPACEELYCSGCTRLVALPALPAGIVLVYYDCPSLQFRPDRAPAQQPNLYQDRINSAAEGTLQDALSFWSGRLPQGQAQLLSAEDLQLSEADQRLFQIFLNRLQETADFRADTPQNFALRVATIVRDMATSEEFREKAIMALGEANESCGDRVATGINNLELLSLMYGENKPQTDVDTAFLAIRLARLDQVRKKAIALNRGAEGLETVLFLELALKNRLQLPLQTEGMLYGGTGHVAPKTVDKTAQEILAATSTDKQLEDILVKSSVWTDFLQRENDVFYGEVLEGLEIIANSAEGTDYPANLAALEKKPTSEWKRFLDNVGPSNASPEKREALQKEVLQALREACPSLTGKDYNTAYNQLIQQIHKKKTEEWLTANGNALRARLNPGA